MPTLSRRLAAPLLAAVLCAAALYPAAHAQPSITWTPRATGLPASVEVFDGRDAALGITATLVRANLSDPAVALEALLAPNGGTRSVADFATQSGAYVAINGGYFGGGQSYSLVVNRGQTLASNIGAINRSGVVFYPTRSALAQLTTGRLDVGWVYDVGGVQTVYPQPSPNAPAMPQPRPTADFPAGGMPWGADVAIGGGPVLVQNGRKRLTWTEEVFFGGSGVDTTEARQRTVAGYDAQGRLLLMVATGRGLTLPEAANVLVAGYGAVEALNLDGGGSSAIWVDGQTLASAGRDVASALVIRPRRDFEARVIDTGDARFYRETGAWFESANSPYYGTTRSRLNETGTGADRATFLVGDAFGSYGGCVSYSAWWVPAPNRARDVQFTLYRNGEQIYRVFGIDQSRPETAGRWNLAGLSLSGSLPGDSLVVTDAATGTTTPSYVNVDAVQIQPGVCPTAEDGPEVSLDVSLGPNPARGSVAVRVAQAQAGTVRVELVDLLGRRVSIVEQATGSGEGTVSVSLSGVPAGLYVVRVATAEGRASRRLTVLPAR